MFRCSGSDFITADVFKPWAYRWEHVLTPVCLYTLKPKSKGDKFITNSNI